MRGLRLIHVFIAALAGLSVLLAALLYVMVSGAQSAVLQAAEQTRSAAVHAAATQVEDYLWSAQKALANVEAGIQRGLTDADDPDAVEAALFAELVANPDLTEVTFTQARSSGAFDDAGNLILADGDRWQMSVYRTSMEGHDAVVTRHTFMDTDGYTCTVGMRGPDGPLQVMRQPKDVALDDPTSHATFSTIAAEHMQSRVSGPEGGMWTDLSYSELDSHLPRAEQQVIYAVMKTAADVDGELLGVLRAGLAARRVDAITDFRVGDDPNDPHRVFVADESGNLITHVNGSESGYREIDGALRVAPGSLEPALSSALEHVSSDSAQFEVDGETWVASSVALEHTWGWHLVLAAPQSHYMGGLERQTEQLLLFGGGIIALILVLGALILRSVQRGLSRITASSAAMRRFEFGAAPPTGTFADVREVLESLELAKTALRAMGKYVPIALVRRLYETGREPMLSGTTQDVTLLFTDIAGFTGISEQLSTDELAALLGRYLEVMTDAIHEHRGSIDKYIGDAVMALWNVPDPCENHSVAACRAALACVDAVNSLEASAEWSGKPAFYTRFGIHTDQVMVGHFGAPDRMAYTVLGDGVNLAARLEGLCKQYGVQILVSRVIRDAADAELDFRFIDIVAVKGRKQGVRVYALMGPKGSRSAACDNYEKAMAAYLERDFSGALAILDAQVDDPASARLAVRCRHYLTSPPPPDWDGVFVATTK